MSRSTTSESPAFAQKRVWVQRALLALTFWPVVQIGLVFTLDVSPWKLGGWGMYAAPIKVPYLALAGAAPGQTNRMSITS